ncbi:MAG: rod shape-determining protein MreD [Bacteroidetes bacterium SB0662_bin_6]|nr:rod shape-determining protein MreD [Bacteroidetes bacterium SB0668_bin_1]MYE04763.1 rod shape-determining protein MreD [Bacteroidetes bacterium SB0662_bin_6]
MPSLLPHILVGALIIAVQWLLLGRLHIWNAWPDAVLLYVAWTAMQFGRRKGALTGFVSGFFMDALYGTWGIQMFVKTLIGFLIGIFQPTERESFPVVPSYIFVGSLAVALLHNGLFALFIALDASTKNVSIVTGIWLGSSLYTAALAGLATLFMTRTR